MPPISAATACPLGHEYNPFSGPHLLNPYPFFARLRKEAPVTFSPQLGVWLVSRYEELQQVLDNPECFSSADILPQGDHLSPEAQALLGDLPLAGSNPLNTDPPLHHRLRRLLQRGFTPARVSALEPTIRQFAHEFVERFAHQGQVDLMAHYAYPLSISTILHMTGVAREDMDQIKQWTGDWFALLFSKVPAEQQVAKVRSVLAYRRYCTALIEERRRQPREDLATYLAQVEPDGDAFTVDEVVTLLGASLVAAGHETTTFLIGMSLRVLLEQPERWQLVRERRELLPSVLEECMRLDSPNMGMSRTTTREVELGGVLLPKGARLFLLFASANHDETMVRRPECFDPRRERPFNITFSRGLHYCLGAQLARLELQVAVETLLERLPDLRLAPDQDFGYTQDMLILRGMKHLRVEWPRG